MRWPERADLGEWRFHQAIVGVISVEALVFVSPAAAAVAVGLILLAVPGPRLSPTAWLWRVFVRPAPGGIPAGPVRAGQLVLAGFVGVGAGLAAAGIPAGWALVGLAAAHAIVGALSGWCAVCWLWSRFQAR